MASKRMFSLAITDTDLFLEMPLSAQALYFHLCMHADDDGFVSSPRRISRSIGANDDDLKLLIAKGFVLAFDDGVLVIAHWRIHNTLSRGRYTETNYLDHKKMLRIMPNKTYTLGDGLVIDDQKLIDAQKRRNSGAPTEQHWSSNEAPTEHPVKNSIDKNSIDKNSIDKYSLDNKDTNNNSHNNNNENMGAKKKGAKAPARAKFQIPTLEEVQAYCFERGNQVDPEKFINYYTSNGWHVGRNKMKDWKAAIRSWEGNGYRSTPAPRTKAEELDDFYKMTAEWAASDDNA